MNEFFKKSLEFIKSIFSKLNTTQKIILFSILGLSFITLIIIASLSSKPDQTLLFQKPLSLEDFAKITKALDSMQAQYKTKDDKYIIVKDKETGDKLRMKLAQEGIIPGNVKGWELFDIQKWTTTDFEREINVQRAIKGEIERQIKLIDGIQEVYLNIAFPKDTLFTTQALPVTATLTIIPELGSNITENKKSIEGIKKIVAYGIPGLTPENVIITDQFGNIISDFSGDDIKNFLDLTKEQMAIVERERVKREVVLRKNLKNFLGNTKVDVQLNIDITFDQIELEKNEIIPVVIKKDNPNTPYDDSEIKDSVVESQQVINKEYKAPGTIPEGPPGVEPNVPPGYKENLGQTIVSKESQTTTNYAFSTQKVNEKKTPYQIQRITCSVWIDGKWEIKVDEKGNFVIDKARKRYVRDYYPYPEEDLKKLAEVVKAAIGYSKERGDVVTVQNIPFNHDEEFAKEDAILQRQETLRKALLTGILSIVGFVIIILLYKIISAEVQRRRKLREEELLRKQQELREQALRAAEKEGVEVELSMEEKARLELQENAINIAREHPEEVAKLIKTWLAEDQT